MWRFTLFGNDYTWATVIGGLVVTLCVALVVLGGIQRIAKVSQVIVPFMAITYVVFALIIVLGHITAIPAAVKLICQSAFDPQAALGAATGVTIKLAMQKGIGRGIFLQRGGPWLCTDCCRCRQDQGHGASRFGDHDRHLY